MLDLIRAGSLAWGSLEDYFTYVVFILSLVFCLAHICMSPFQSSLNDEEPNNDLSRYSWKPWPCLWKSRREPFNSLALWWCRDKHWPSCTPKARLAFLLTSSVFLVQYARELQDHAGNDALWDVWPTRHLFTRSGDILLLLELALPVAYLVTVACVALGILLRSNLCMLASIPCQGFLSVLLLYADACLHPLKQPHHRLYACIVATVGLGMTGAFDDTSSFISKWTTLTACATYFPGSVSKLLTERASWLMDGSVLCSHIEHDAVSCGKSCPEAIVMLRNYVLNRRPVCVLLSITTVIFEGLSPLVLFSSSLLPWFCFCMCVFHSSVKLLMRPSFAPQCLLVLPMLGSLVPQRRRLSQQHQCRLQPGDHFRAAVATCFALAVLVATCLRLEVYPLSTISMYSISCNDVTWRHPIAGAETGVVFSSDASLARLVHLCAVRQAITCYPRMFFLKSQGSAASNLSHSKRLPLVLAADLFECIDGRDECHPLLRLPSWDSKLPLCSSPQRSHSTTRRLSLMAHSSLQSTYAEQVEIARPRMEALITDAAFAQLLWLNSSRPITEHSFAAARTDAWPAGGPADALLRPSVATWLQEQICGLCPAPPIARPSRSRMLRLRLGAHVHGKLELKIISMEMPCPSHEDLQAITSAASTGSLREEM